MRLHGTPAQSVVPIGYTRRPIVGEWPEDGIAVDDEYEGTEAEQHLREHW